MWKRASERDAVGCGGGGGGVEEFVCEWRMAWRKQGRHPPQPSVKLGVLVVFRRGTESSL